MIYSINIKDDENNELILNKSINESSKDSSYQNSISINVDNIQENNPKLYPITSKTLSDDSSIPMDLFNRGSEINLLSLVRKESNLMNNNIIENYTSNLRKSKVDISDFIVEIPKISNQCINNQKIVFFF